MHLQGFYDLSLSQRHFMKHYFYVRYEFEFFLLVYFSSLTYTQLIFQI